MPAKVARVVRECLQTLSAPLSDAELLRRFKRNRDADAFAELVARHGPVVLGVCRRALGRSPDVDDAFQATFLALARRPGSVRDPARLAGWLHRVALRASGRVTKRRRATRSMDEAGAVASAPEPRDLSWSEGLTVLDEELTRLPDRLRMPLVLCYLEGLTRDEAAERLSWSLAFLKRRMEEGRRRLRDRLVRRGVSSALLAAATGLNEGLRAAVPSNLLLRTAALSVGQVPDSVHACLTAWEAFPCPRSLEEHPSDSFSFLSLWHFLLCLVPSYPNLRQSSILQPRQPGRRARPLRRNQSS